MPNDDSEQRQRSTYLFFFGSLLFLMAVVFALIGQWIVTAFCGIFAILSFIGAKRFASPPRRPRNPPTYHDMPGPNPVLVIRTTPNGSNTYVYSNNSFNVFPQELSAGGLRAPRPADAPPSYSSMDPSYGVFAGSVSSPEQAEEDVGSSSTAPAPEGALAFKSSNDGLPSYEDAIATRSESAAGFSTP
ncbi:uncharacterized protein LOC135212013 isoform X2 [Macrobrachium nipponense]|uniref:uncharacterized protein LOC135212013 isoform X2 n=1 Tax=Macrobrachium nipponense TaxID=159736 RepID=UPI0030C83E80